MCPRPKRVLLAGTAAATLSLALPALAADETGAAAPTYQFAAPAIPQGGGVRARSEKSPGQQQLPTPAPSGCPFRDGKLELIV